MAGNGKVSNPLALTVLSYLSRAPMHPYDMVRTRTTYALTQAGREEWHHWLRELIEDPRHEYPQFATALSLLAALPPGEVTGLLRERSHRVAQVRAETQAMISKAVAEGLAPLFLVDEEYRVALLDAETTFLEKLIERITDPKNGWAGPWTEHLHQAHLP